MFRWNETLLVGGLLAMCGVLLPSVPVSPQALAAAPLKVSDDPLPFSTLSPGQLFTCIGHKEGTNALCFLKNGDLITAGQDGNLLSFPPASPEKPVFVDPYLARFESALCDVISAPDSPSLALATSDVIRFPSELRKRGGMAIPGRDKRLAVSLDGKLLAVSIEGAHLELFDTRTSSFLQVKGNGFGTQSVKNHAVAFSPDGRWLASGGDAPEQLALWSVPDFAERRLLTPPQGTGRIMSAIFTHDSQQIITGHSGGKHAVCIWDPASGRVTRQLTPEKDPDGKPIGPPGDIHRVALAPNGKTFASAGDDGIVRLWDLASGQELSQWAGHRHPVTCVAFSPDGSMIASGDRGGTVALWSVECEVSRGRLIQRQASAEELDKDWRQLATLSGRVAKRQVAWRLAATESSTAFLGRVLQRMSEDDPVRLAEWATQLDDPRYAVREQVTRNLRRALIVALPILERERGGRSAEAATRIDRLLESDTVAAELERARFAIQILRQRDGLADQRVLQDLSRRFPNTWLATEIAKPLRLTDPPRMLVPTKVDKARENISLPICG